MYDYNTSREPMKLRQFGRNVQNLANYVASLESKEERSRYSAALVELMKQIVPSAKANMESSQMLWDDLHILADYKLDVESPYPVPEVKLLDRKPEKVEYRQENLAFRHYGRNVTLLIETAKNMKDPEEKETATFQVARLMKTFHISWNKENPENSLIAKNIDILSGGELKLNLEKAEEFDLMEPLYRDSPKTHQHKSGKGGKSQNRRRR